MADANPPDKDSGPLAGLRVLDLSRILAGPTCTQLLGDMGADIIKVERPVAGDDTRKWGPPYVTGHDGQEAQESAYYLCANRNKRSVTIDMANPDGAAIIKELAKSCDILIENFKVGGLARYGLSYGDLKDDYPGLIYCSISGFGQTGPNKDKPGYDFMAQGVGGIMSLTGEPDGSPMKTAVGIADVMCGMYASSAILAAVHHRTSTGEGQYIDIALADSQVAWLINEGTNYLTSGDLPKRRGNAHPNIVPYQLLEAADDYFILAVGNDRQFQRFCTFANLDGLAMDDRFATNQERIRNRDDLIPRIEAAARTKSVSDWLEGLAALGVPCGPVNTLDKVFNDPQFVHRGMKIQMEYPSAASGCVNLIGNPVHFSKTPVTYRQAPPRLGEQTTDVLAELTTLSKDQINQLKTNRVI